MSNELEDIAKSICNNQGLLFDRYVGSGSFKETYHVLDRENSLALKVFRRGFSPERTERELDAMLVCDHPNIGKQVLPGSPSLDRHCISTFSEKILKCEIDTEIKQSIELELVRLSI